MLSGLVVATLERFTSWRNLSLRTMAGLGRQDHRVRRAIARMRATPGTVCGIDVLANEAGLSRAHFYRLFQQSTGAAPHVFLNAIRVERAVAAIVSGPDSIADIGTDLGFAAPAHFSRFFRDHAGIPPGAFRSTARRGLRLPCENETPR